MLESLLYDAPMVTIIETTHTTLLINKGKLHRCTSASAVTITLDEDMPVGWQGVFVQEGAGVVTFQKEESDTLNGGSGTVAIPLQWKTAYVYQHTEGAWVVIV